MIPPSSKPPVPMVVPHSMKCPVPPLVPSTPPSQNDPLAPPPATVLSLHLGPSTCRLHHGSCVRRLHLGPPSLRLPQTPLVRFCSVCAMNFRAIRCAPSLHLFGSVFPPGPPRASVPLASPQSFGILALPQMLVTAALPRSPEPLMLRGFIGSSAPPPSASSPSFVPLVLSAKTPPWLLALTLTVY
ncbi:hypothetical protein PO909_009028 [Leuciscus waleckii]